MAYYTTRRQISMMWRWVLLTAILAGVVTLAAFGRANGFWPKETPMYIMINVLIAFLWGFVPGSYLAFAGAMFRDWLSRPDEAFPEGPRQKWRRPLGLPPRWYYKDVILTDICGPIDETQ